MAGDWIAWSKGLARKPEVYHISRVTGRSRRDVAATLMEFWEWADSETADGTLPSITLEQLSDVVPGTDDKFWLAVIQADWLRALPNGQGLLLPNFHRWLGKSAKQRLSKTIRQARWRSPGVGADVDDEPSTREPNQREPGEEAYASSPLPDEPASTDATTTSKTSRKRKRDPLWDAVVEVTGSDPKVSAPHIGRVVKALREADTPYTAEEVLALPAVLEAEGWTYAITLGTITKYIHWVREPPRKIGGKKKRESTNDRTEHRFRG
jgi:hypothetical protein